MRKLPYYYFWALIIFLPFQKLFEAVLSRWLATNALFWISHWYEIALVVLIVVSIISLVRSRSCPDFKLFNKPALYYVALSLISALFIAANLSRGLEGFRFAALPVVFLLLTQIVPMNERQKRMLTGVYLTMAALIAFWAIIERYLPLNYWQYFSLSDFGWGKYHLAEQVYQSATFMNGPNQVASYLLPALFIQFGEIKKNNRLAGIILALVMLAAIILTFSRAAAIALVLGLFIYFASGPIARKVKIVLAVSLAALILIAYLTARSLPSWQALIYHGTSQSFHEESLKLSIDELKKGSINQWAIGRGIGSAGPAALKYGDGIISESWYLELLLELGIIGLALWLWLIADLSVKLWRVRNMGLLAGLVSVSVAAIFLHTWADNPAVAISLFILLGSIINQRENKKI